MKFLTIFTPLSERPLDQGLLGEDNSLLLPLSSQKATNSERNWGSTSVLITIGQPRVLNHPVNTLVKDEEVPSRCHSLIQPITTPLTNTDNMLVTQKSYTSIQMWLIGGPRDDGGSVDLEFFG